MVIIWLMMVNNNLVGGFHHLEKYEFVNWEGDDIPYEMEKNPWFQSPPTSDYENHYENHHENHHETPY